MNPEQQEKAAVEAYMRGMGFVFDKYYWILAQDDDVNLEISPEEATFFYRATQAQVAEALERALKAGPKDIPPYGLTDTGKAMNAMNKSWREAIVAQNPKQPTNTQETK